MTTSEKIILLIANAAFGLPQYREMNASNHHPVRQTCDELDTQSIYPLM